MFQAFSDFLLFASCILIVLASLYLTFKLHFIQLRLFPLLWKRVTASFSKEKVEEGKGTILPHKALFTAMSTTLGISTIVAPVIAIYMGGPGALLGFLIVAFFGSAATYLEVKLCIQYRKKLPSGGFMGGPMQYLKAIFSPFIAKWYAVACMILMMAWSSAQANQLAAIFNSPLFGGYRIPVHISGLLIVAFSLFALMGGIKRIGALSAKMVPMMFILYVGSTLFIIASNAHRLGDIFALIVRSAFSPYPLASGALVGGVVSALRWGIFKGAQTSEAGVGTQAIPHSMAETRDGEAQGVLAMLSTYTAGLVAFLSGIVALLTNTWQDPSLPLGISMVVASFAQYFSYFGVLIIAFSTLLFGFGTILGNSYNGSQCFGYLTGNTKLKLYFLATGGTLFLGAVSEVKFVWSIVDLILVAVVIPHILALTLYTYRQTSPLAPASL